MSEPILNVMKIMLLSGLYLFFVRVLWSVFNELRDPRTRVRQAAPAKPRRREPARGTVRQPAGTAPVATGAAPHAGAVITANPAAVGQLVVIEPAKMAGMRYPLGYEVTLGRAPTNAIALDDTYVSTVHARIFQTNGKFFVEDLASRNGSTLNGAPVVATTALRPGDRLQIGATLMEFS